MSDKEGDSSEDIQMPIEFTVLQSETKSFQVPPDQDVFFTNAELVNIQPDSSNKVVTLSIDYEVVYFHSENSSEDENENKTEANAIKSNSDQFIEGDQSNNSENKSTPVGTSLNENRVPKKALDHIIITIPISSSSSLPSTADSNSLNTGSSNSSSNSNQSTITPSQPNTTDNSFSTNFLNHNYNYNSNANSNSASIQIQFCPDMNPVFHVSGPADVKLTGFTAPTNYNLIEEEEESESESESENEEIDENAQEENQNGSDDEKIEDIENLNEKEQISVNENEISPN